MRGLAKRSVYPVSLLVGCVAVVLSGPRPASALIDDVFTTRTQPATALLMPFDATEGHTSFLLVSNVAGTSTENSGALTTHWTFWSDSCAHLVDVNICLTINDTIVVDPLAVQGRDASNAPVGPTVDLSGNRGFVTVTAYETDAACSAASALGFKLVRQAIVGTATLAILESSASYGFDSVGLFADPSGSFVDLPDYFLSPDGSTGFLAVQAYNPETLTDSQVVVLAVAENTGDLEGEIGPIGRNVTANCAYYDTVEAATSLPDVTISCAEFASLSPGAEGSLIPGFVSLLSSGVLRMSNIRAGSVPVGFDNWVYGFIGQSVESFGGAWSAKYQVNVEPLPTSTGSQPPTPTPAPTATPVGATPTPAPSGSPGPTPTGGAPTPTPGGPTATPGPTATGGATPTPAPTATGAATPTPAPTATGAATPTPTPAVTATPTPAPTGSAGCTTATVTITTSFVPPEGDPVSGVTTTLDYPEAKIGIPGVGGGSDVASRITFLVSGGLPGVSDDDLVLSVGLVNLSQAIPPGQFARAVFDCVAGQPAPVAADFSCTPAVSTFLGFDVSATCSASVSLQ